MKFTCISALMIIGFTVFADAQSITDADWGVFTKSQLPGLNGSVKSVICRDGYIYVAGDFSIAGSSLALNLAKWDGKQWSSMGNISTVSITGMCVDKSGNFYAAGYFDSIAGVKNRCITKYDGTKWVSIGAGISKVVTAVAVDENGILYAGGLFDSAAGVFVNHITRWDGNKWDSLGSGIIGFSSSYSIKALMCDGKGNLYAGGQFLSAGGVHVNNIARWDGSKWDSLGPGLPDINEVLALSCDSSGNIYAAGYGTKIKKWDGTKWSVIGTAYTGISVYVLSLACDKAGNLYAGGDFYSVDSVRLINIGKWDGTKWSPLRSGVNAWYGGDVLSITFDENGDLIAGGSFDSASGIPASNIARWNGNEWSVFGQKTGGYSGTINAISLDKDGSFFAGGSFNTLDGNKYYNIAKWDGSEWNGFGAGINGTVYALCRDSSDNLYAGGSFTKAGDEAAVSIARWDGTGWKKLGSGVAGTVYALASDDKGNIYAGGFFGSAGDSAAAGVAMWNGTKWSRLKAGMYGSKDTVFALVWKYGQLFAGGRFKEAGGVTANNIARWDGNSWNSLNSGTDAVVRSLAFDKYGMLYAGGDFDSAGSVKAIGLAAWNGNTWKNCSLTASVNAIVCENNGNIYVGQTVSSDMRYKGLLKWDGKGWDWLGSGVRGGKIHALAIYDSILVVAGEFLSAGLTYAPCIAKVNIHDIPAAVGPARKDPRMVLTGISYRIHNSTLVFTNITPDDKIALYSLSGRCIRKAQGVSFFDISNITGQIVLVRVDRKGNTIVKGTAVLQR